jgi:hypothetical protein
MKFLDLTGLTRYHNTLMTQIDAKLASVLKFVGSVDYQNLLPTAGNSTGDVRFVRYTGTSGTTAYNAEFWWTGSEWDLLGVINEVDLSNYVVKEDGKGLSTNDYTTLDKGVVNLLSQTSVNGLILSQPETDLIGYAVCSTAAATAAKAVTLTSATFKLITGSQFAVKFSIANTAASPTLNVNSTGAKPIFYKGAAITASHLKANYAYNFVYDGTNWVLIGEIDTTYSAATTSTAGLMSAADKTKLDGITTAATADSALTDAEIDALFD